MKLLLFVKKTLFVFAFLGICAAAVTAALHKTGTSETSAVSVYVFFASGVILAAVEELIRSKK